MTSRVDCAALLDEHARLIDGSWVDGAALPGADFDNAIDDAVANNDRARLQAARTAYQQQAQANCQELAPCAHVNEPVLIQWVSREPTQLQRDGDCKMRRRDMNGQEVFLETADAEKHTTQKPHEALVREPADFARVTNYRCER